MGFSNDKFADTNNELIVKCSHIDGDLIFSPTPYLLVYLTNTYLNIATNC